jgi:hypothetical protein
MPEKLYVVVRADLSAGQQAVQACHAVREFTQEFPDERADTVVLLQVDDESSLSSMLHRAVDHGARYRAFREPDIGDALTAIAIAPEGRRLCRRLPLALSNS